MSANPTSSSVPPSEMRPQTASALPSQATYAGILSFMRRPQTRELAGVDVVVSGIPLDLATTFRPGSRFGPAAVRAASAQLAELKPFPWGVDPFETLKVVDYGDCAFDAHNPLTIRDAIVTHARTILASGARMLTLGGDHYVTYPLLRAHAEKYGKPLSLIHFDAHTDTWPDDHPDSLNHGTMFYKAVQEGLIDPARSVQVGIRTWNDDTMGIRVLSAPWVHQHGVEKTLETILSIVGDSPTYLTFDIDCLDPAFAPGTGTPVPGGLSSAQALQIIRSMTPVNLIGADVVEVAPAYDHAELTTVAAATVAYDLITLMARARGLPARRG